jgi:hypothetical protein
VDGHHARGPVNGDELSGVQPLRGVAGSNDCGNPVLAGHQGSVRGQGAAVGDDGGGTCWVAASRNFQVSALAVTVPVNRSILMDQSRARTEPTWWW